MEPAFAASTGLPTDQLTDIFLSQGLMGAVVVALVYFILMLRGELRDLRAAHKIEIAAKDSLILDLQKERLADTRELVSVMNSFKTTMESILVAVRQA